MPETPLYTHDCPLDHYLGRHTTSDGTTYDLYHYDHAIGPPGLLARYGNADHENLTSEPNANKDLLPLWQAHAEYPMYEAFTRAVAAGYFDNEGGPAPAEQRAAGGDSDE